MSRFQSAVENRLYGTNTDNATWRDALGKKYWDATGDNLRITPNFSRFINLAVRLENVHQLGALQKPIGIT